MLLQDQNIFFGQYDLTTTMNSVALVLGRETQDKTTFKKKTRIYEAGLKTATAEAGGFYDADPYDEALHDELGIEDTPFTVTDGDTVGAGAYSFKALEGDYTPFQNTVGDIASYSAGAVATGDPIRGKLLYKGQNISVDGQSTPLQLGALPADKKLYAVVHVFAVTGTLDLKVQSDNAQVFTSPTDRITIPQFTVPGTYWIELTGANADNWYRLDINTGGGSPSSDFAVILAIQ